MDSNVPGWKKRLKKRRARQAALGQAQRQTAALLREEKRRIRREQLREQRERLDAWIHTPQVLASPVPGSIRADLGLSPVAARALRDRLVAEQGNRCAICCLAFGPSLPPHLDHCHRLKKARAALCHRCNTLLAMARDNPEVLRRAAAYVEMHD